MKSVTAMRSSKQSVRSVRFANSHPLDRLATKVENHTTQVEQTSTNSVIFFPRTEPSRFVRDVWASPPERLRRRAAPEE